MTDRKFYKTTFIISVLSEYPLDKSYPLDEIHYMITDGDCSGSIKMIGSTPIDAISCAQELLNQESEPEFFGINEAGEEVDRS